MTLFQMRVPINQALFDFRIPENHALFDSGYLKIRPFSKTGLGGGYLKKEIGRRPTGNKPGPPAPKSGLPAHKPGPTAPTRCYSTQTRSRGTVTRSHSMPKPVPQHPKTGATHPKLVPQHPKPIRLVSLPPEAGRGRGMECRGRVVNRASERLSTLSPLTF